MVKKLFLLIAISSLTGCSLNKSKFYFSDKNFGVSLGVKSKKEYILHINKIDKTQISRDILIQGNLESMEYFNKDGLIIKQIRILKPDSSQNITTYEYDKRKNLIFQQYKNDKKNLKSSSIYKYDNAKRKVIKHNKNKKSPIKGKIYEIAKEEKKFNPENQIIELIFYNDKDSILKVVKNSFDNSFNLKSRESYLKNSLESKRIFSYDSMGRIKNSRTTNEKGILINERTYQYMEDGIIFLTVFNKNKEVQDKMKTIYFKDEKGNVTKEYIFNFQKGYTIIKNYLIEYY